MIWKLRSGRVHLIPTMHFLSHRDYPMRREWAKAYTRSNVIAFESNWSASDMETFRRTNGEGSIGSAGDDFLAQVTTTFSRLNLATESIALMRPHYASMHISAALYAEQGLSSEHGLDAHVRNRAMANGKVVQDLESPTAIDELAKSIPFDVQIAELRRTIANLDTERARTGTTLDAWRAGNVDRLASCLSEIEGELPEFWSPIIGGRNQSWLSEVLRIHESGEPTLICVGALHCVGPRGLPSLITAAGVQTTYS